MLSDESEDVKLVVHEDLALIQIMLARACNKVHTSYLKLLLSQAKEIIDQIYTETDVLPF